MLGILRSSLLRRPCFPSIPGGTEARSRRQRPPRAKPSKPQRNSARPRHGTRLSRAFPYGFYADLARAYLKNLGENSGGAAAAPAASPAPAGSGSAPAETPKVELGANANLNGVRLLPVTAPGIRTSRKRRSTATPRAFSRESATSRCIPISVPCGGRAHRLPLRRRDRHAEEGARGIHGRRRERPRSLPHPARRADRRRGERRWRPPRPRARSRQLAPSHEWPQNSANFF
jgi:hypothetical protein